MIAKRRYCGDHKVPGVIISPNRCCESCREPALWGAMEPARCDNHKFKDDDNLVERACAKCNLAMRLNAKSLLCVYCSGVARRLVRQREVKNYLQANLNIPWNNYDSVTEDSKKWGDKERPDIFWDRGDYCVVLEVDEDQHKRRPEECDCMRMVNLHSNFGRPTYFIRFNPDDYSPSLGDDAMMLSLKKRMSVLTDWLRCTLTTEPCKSNSDDVMHLWFLRLFFDGEETSWARIT